MGWFRKVFGIGRKKNSGPSAEQVAADQAKADAARQLASVNASKDAMTAQLMDIQKQALAQQADSDNRRAQQETARAAAAAKAEQDRQTQAEAENIRAANQKTDLLSENLTNVVAGGTADQEVAAEVLRKKAKNATLSQQLGINV